MSDIDFVPILANVSLFSMVDRRPLKKIAKNCELLQYGAGQVITTEGDRDGRLFIVHTGRVRIMKNLGTDREVEVATLGPNSYFGEMALIGDFVRTASVVADTDVEVVALGNWNFRELIGKYPSLAVDMMQTLARRLRDVENQLV